MNSLQRNFRPKSSYLGNITRKVDYQSPVFTTDIITVDKQADDIEDMILKYNKRPRTTEKKVRIGIDLNEKHKQQMQRNGEQLIVENQDSYYHHQGSIHNQLLQGKNQMTRVQSAYISTQNQIQSSQGSNLKLKPLARFQSGRISASQQRTQLSSPTSHYQHASTAIMSQKSSQRKNYRIQSAITSQKTMVNSQSAMTLKSIEYQKFFQKNQDKAFGIAEYVITGTKMQPNKKLSKQDQQTLKNQHYANIQTENADTLNESEFIINDEDQEGIIDGLEDQPKDPKLIYQGAYVKVFKPLEKEKPIKTRPVSAAQLLKPKTFTLIKQEKNSGNNKNINNGQITIEDLKSDKIYQQKKFDSKKLSKTLKNEADLQKSIFREKKQKSMELNEYLELVLNDYQKEQFQQNQNEIDRTLSQLNATTDLNNIQNLDVQSLQNSKLCDNDLTSSVISSTGIRLRKLTAKYGPKIDLISHGFQRFQVQDIEHFFDPLRIKLLIVNINEIPNQYTKQGSDFHFIKGFKYQMVKDFQNALNCYESGIQEYPKSSFNCRLNKGIVLFKLGLFKEALFTFSELEKIDHKDKRICYNKAICELQNGKFSSCIYTIDSYIEDFNRRKKLIGKERDQDNKTLSYQERIQSTKSNYIPDNTFLYEIYQIRGVACLRSKRVVEASKSFAVAQEFRQLIPNLTIKQQQSGVSSSIDSDSVQDIQQQDYTEITLDQNSNLFRSPKYMSQSIKFEDQQQNSDRKHLQSSNDVKTRIRPMIANLPKSQSQRNFLSPFPQQQRLETLEEEEQRLPTQDQQFEDLNSQQNQQSISQSIDEQSSVSQQNYIPDHYFNLDSSEIMKTLDKYDIEHHFITNQVLKLHQFGKTTKNQTLQLNRNIDTYMNCKNFAKAQSRNNKDERNLHFTQKNLKIDKPKGLIQNFIINQQQEQDLKSDNKRFLEKIKYYEIYAQTHKTKIQHQPVTQNNSQSKQQQQLSSRRMEGETTEEMRQMLQEGIVIEGEVEEETLMRPEQIYIDYDKKIRLDKVMLGFEIDPMNDSITEEELKVRNRRSQIEQDLFQEKDSFYDLLEKQSAFDLQQKKDYFLQFLKLSDKDLLIDSKQIDTLQSLHQLDKMTKQLQKNRDQIDQIFKDPKKTDLSLDQTNAMAIQMSQILEKQGHQQSLDSSRKILNQTQSKQEEQEQKQQITKRLSLIKLQIVVQQFLKENGSERDMGVLQQYIGNLKFFIKFPAEIKYKLFEIAELKVFQKGDVIFTQSSPSYSFFMILRGSVCLSVQKEELGHIPVISKVCYDGDYFGELAHFQESQTLTKKVVEELNKQRCTTIAMEECYILQLDKKLANSYINSGLQGKFESRIEFLRQIDIFADIDMYILLPLASNIQVKRFKMGEYIVKAGEMPEGLIIIKEGQCIVSAEKLGMRSSIPSEYSRLFQNPLPPNIKTNPTGSSHLIYDKQQLKDKNIKQYIIKNQERYYSDSLANVNTASKAYQNEKILVDDNGKRMKDFTVYKDLMVFFTLLPKSYFGGRVLLPSQQKKETDDEKDLTKSTQKQSTSKGRRAGWFAGQSGAKQPSIKGDFEHLFIKRRYSQTTQNIMKNDRSSMLSVIAHSNTVEVFIIDTQLMEFFPENTQKLIWNKLMHVFEPDRPYMMKNVQKIKDKFREWDVYKIKSVQDALKNNADVRKAEKVKIGQGCGR